MSLVESRQKKGRFLAFSLRQLLLLLALSAVLLGLVTPQIRRTLRGWQVQEDSDMRFAVAADLNAAVQANDVALARQALEAGADPNFSPWENLLNTCIVNGRVETLELLLKFGADADEPLYGNAPLFVAAGCKQPPEIRCRMIRLLVDAGADPRTQFDDPAGDPSRRALNAMDIAFGLADAQTGDLLREYGLPYGPREMVAFNRLDELKRAVKQNPEIVREHFHGPWTYGGEKTTLLAIAIARSCREIAAFLVETGAPLDTLAHPGWTLLHLAARSVDPEIIRLLVARGLEVDAANGQFDTPLIIATYFAKPDSVAALLKAGANVNHHGYGGRTPLHWAVGNLEIVQTLLAAGADPTLADEKEETPLDLARMHNPQNPAIIRLLEQAMATKPAPIDD